MPTINAAFQSFNMEVSTSTQMSPASKTAYAYAMRIWKRSLVERKIPSGSLSTRKLCPSAVAEFATWLSNTRYQRPSSKNKPTHYSWKSIQLFLIVLRRALKMWRSKSWIGFSEQEEKLYFLAHYRVEPAIYKKDSKRAASIPPDFGPTLLRAAMSMALPTGDSYFTKLRRLHILRTRALIAVFVSTGLRVSDVCRLTIRDFEAAQKTGFLSIPTTPRRGQIKVRLRGYATTSISRYLENRPQRSPFLFTHLVVRKTPGQSRDPICMRELEARLAVYETLALAYPNNPRPAYFGPHTIRHWYVQDQIRRGLSVQELQIQLGHSSQRTTRLVYPGSSKA